MASAVSVPRRSKRSRKAEYEMSFAPQFDTIIVNDELSKAQQDIFRAVSAFIEA